MTYLLPKEAIPKQVTLKVENLESMVAFYTTSIGLVLIEKVQGIAFLGVEASSTPLLILKEIPQPIKKEKTAGLYHVAFLLPTRKDLGKSLLWLLQNEIEVGAGDHGYSEAIYLADPEGNGIEIYRDRPMDEWDIRPTGEIIGVTEELDGEAVLAAAEGEWTGLPLGSKIGHIHLQVSDLEATSFFYEALGFSLKAKFGPQAKFFAAGDYHHHIGINTWAGKQLTKMTETQLGLDSYAVELPNKEEYARFKTHLDNLSFAYQSENEMQLRIEDPSGVEVIFTYKNNF